MSENDKPVQITARSRTRSPAYPMFSLRHAVDQVKKLWESQHKHSAHLDSVVQTMGYSKQTGASLRAVSALGQFGLLTIESGSGDDRRVALSDLALDIATGSSEQKNAALQAAALEPTIYKELWSRYGENSPSKEVLRAFLIRDKNFNPVVVDDVIEDYQTSIDYANLHITMLEDGPKKLSAEPGKFAFSGAPANLSKESPAPTMSANVRYLTIPLEIGDALIPLGMSKGDWKLFIEAQKVFKPRIVNEPDDSQDSALNELAAD